MPPMRRPRTLQGVACPGQNTENDVRLHTHSKDQAVHASPPLDSSACVGMAVTPMPLLKPTVSMLLGRTWPGRRMRLLFCSILVVSFPFCAALWHALAYESRLPPHPQAVKTGSTLDVAGAVSTVRRVNPGMPLVAVCIAGQLRTFTQVQVRMSIMYHVLEPLRDAGFDVHTFFHLAESDASQLDMVDIARAGSNNMFSSFGPATLSFSSPDAKHHHHHEGLNTKWKTDDNCPVPRCASPEADRADKVCPRTLLRADECMQQVRAVQRRLKNNRTFDWIVRTRPDIALATNISISSDMPTTQLYANMHMPEMSLHAHDWLRQRFPNNTARVLSDRHPIGDLVHIVPASVAPVVFSASQAWMDCDLFNIHSGTIGPEVALIYWLVKHNLPYTPMPWLWMIVRRFDGPVCENVRHIQTADAKMNEQMLKTCASFKQTGVLSVD